MAGSWILESKKGSNARKADSRGRAVKECEDFLASVETELRSTEEFGEEHGVFPIEYYGREHGPAHARKHLTRLELHSPPSVHKAAVTLVEKLEGWTSGASAREDYVRARVAFVSEFRRKLA